MYAPLMSVGNTQRRKKGSLQGPLIVKSKTAQVSQKGKWEGEVSLVSMMTKYKGTEETTDSDAKRSSDSHICLLIQSFQWVVPLKLFCSCFCWPLPNIDRLYG